ncbi:MAG: hypothetical protein ACR2OC_01495 [Solirubrobacterales bacterium]
MVTSSTRSKGQKAVYPMGDDEIVGDGGNLTVYERPDKSRYALDRKGHGSEWVDDGPIFGRARFDARDCSTGVWPDSRSTPQPVEAEPARARLHGRPKVR